MLQLSFVIFVVAFIWGLKRSRRRLLTAVCTAASMVVTLFALDRIARLLPYDHGTMAFMGIESTFVVGAIAAYLHSAYTLKKVAVAEPEFPQS